MLLTVFDGVRCGTFGSESVVVTCSDKKTIFGSFQGRLFSAVLTDRPYANGIHRTRMLILSIFNGEDKRVSNALFSRDGGGIQRISMPVDDVLALWDALVVEFALEPEKDPVYKNRLDREVLSDILTGSDMPK